MSTEYDGPLETATRAVMEHYGYTKEQINEAEHGTHSGSGCEFSFPGWECFDDGGESNHPIMDELDRTADALRVALKAVGIDA